MLRNLFLSILVLLAPTNGMGGILSAIMGSPEGDKMKEQFGEDVKEDMKKGPVDGGISLWCKWSTVSVLSMIANAVGSGCKEPSRLGGLGANALSSRNARVAEGIHQRLPFAPADDFNGEHERSERTKGWKAIKKLFGKKKTLPVVKMHSYDDDSESVDYGNYFVHDENLEDLAEKHFKDHKGPQATFTRQHTSRPSVESADSSLEYGLIQKHDAGRPSVESNDDMTRFRADAIANELDSFIMPVQGNVPQDAGAQFLQALGERAMTSDNGQTDCDSLLETCEFCFPRGARELNCDPVDLLPTCQACFGSRGPANQRHPGIPEPTAADLTMAATYDANDPYGLANLPDFDAGDLAELPEFDADFNQLSARDGGNPQDEPPQDGHWGCPDYMLEAGFETWDGYELIYNVECTRKWFYFPGHAHANINPELLAHFGVPNIAAMHGCANECLTDNACTGYSSYPAQAGSMGSLCVTCGAGEARVVADRWVETCLGPSWHIAQPQDDDNLSISAREGGDDSDDWSTKAEPPSWYEKDGYQPMNMQQLLDASKTREQNRPVEYTGGMREQIKPMTGNFMTGPDHSSVSTPDFPRRNSLVKRRNTGPRRRFE